MLAAAQKWPRLMPAGRCQRLQSLAFAPAGTACLAIDLRGLREVNAAVGILVPMNVAEELQEVAVTAVRAFDGCLPLVAVQEARLDPAFTLDRRRACPHRQVIGKGRLALVAQANRIALARDDIFVRLVVHGDTDGAARQIVGRACAHHGEEAARERLVGQRLVGRPALF